jgi:hypothetical protein
MEALADVPGLFCDPASYHSGIRRFARTDWRNGGKNIKPRRNNTRNGFE